MTEAKQKVEPDEAPAEIPMPTNVIAALARVAEELPGIGKDQDSSQGYKYRGIEQITAHAQTLLGKYGVVFVPRVVGREVKEFPLGGKPWTEDAATIVYRIYGPGGVEDMIEVGPLIALGRDNSDKGMNKCMTQAFKYALLQVLCVGDSKDDTDADVARTPDARAEPLTPERQLRVDLGKRIAGLEPAQREQVRSFCEEHKIPAVTARMDDDQVEAAGAKVDAILIVAEQDAAAEAGEQLPLNEGVA